jgi:peptide/nickel transport system substrate-binding protein
MGPTAPAAVVMAGALLLAGCAGTAAAPPEDPAEPLELAAATVPPPGAAARDPRVVRVARLPAHLDPQRIDGGEADPLARALLHRTLVTYRVGPAGDPPTAVPDLAVGLGVASGMSTTWTYTLRPGLRFEDGTPMTAGDLRRGLSRLFARELHGGRRAAGAEVFAVPSSYPGPYRATPAQRRVFERAVPVTPDGLTISFRLTRPVPDFDRWAASLALAPVPPGDTGARYDRHPLATGPYRVLRSVGGVSIVLSRNPYWSRALDPLRANDADTVVVLAGTGRTATP